MECRLRTRSKWLRSARKQESGMSIEDVERARTEWFAAPDLQARFVAVQALQQQAAPWVTWPVRKEAMGHLIELIHISDHPSLRARLIEALGLVQSLQAVPALHAELHHTEAKVRQATVDALGQLGMLFAGAVVARWLEARDRAAEPPGMMDAALRTLALTGHPDTAHWATTLWEAGEVEATTVHLALAEVVSSEGLELAKGHLKDPVAAIPAALHLSAVRHPELRVLLKPLFESSDLQQLQTAETLVSRRWESAQDEVIAYISDKLYGREVGRRARRLRVHPPADLITVFELFCEDHPLGSRERSKFLARMASIGVPELQSMMFAWAIASGEPGNLVPILRAASGRHPELQAQLHRLMQHKSPDVVVYAMRCQVNLLASLKTSDLAPWGSDARPAVAAEAVRSAMTLWRDQKQSNRRTSLTGAPRRALEQMMRAAVRKGETATRVQAAFAVGNLGLTALYDELLRLRTDPAVGVRQGAAASLHALPPGKKLDELVAWLGSEPEADVRVRLGLALLTALQEGESVPGGLEAIAMRAVQSRDDMALVELHLCGFVGSTATVNRLLAAADDPRLATAAAALTALGLTKRPAVLSALSRASRQDDPVRRRRAVEALGVLGSPAAASALVKVAKDELEPSVRKAALRSLARCPCSAMEARQLVPQGASDPMMYELLEARVAAAGGRLDVAAVDAGLEERFKGLKVARLARLSEDALRALRTAHFLDSGVQLPEGLDAAPPVVFWAKGLELWMNSALRPMLQELRSPRGRKALAGAKFVWSGWEHLVPGWTPSGGNRWKNLLSVVQRSADDPRKVWTLRALAGGLLCAGPLAERMRLPPRLSSVSSHTVGELAHNLVCLSDLRNRLTHNASGRAKDASEASARAAEIGRCLAEHF